MEDVPALLSYCFGKKRVSSELKFVHSRQIKSFVCPLLIYVCVFLCRCVWELPDLSDGSGVHWPARLFCSEGHSEWWSAETGRVNEGATSLLGKDTQQWQKQVWQNAKWMSNKQGVVFYSFKMFLFKVSHYLSSKPFHLHSSLRYKVKISHLKASSRRFYYREIVKAVRCFLCWAERKKYCGPKWLDQKTLKPKFSKRRKVSCFSFDAVWITVRSISTYYHYAANMNKLFKNVAQSAADLHEMQIEWYERMFLE